jgi:hypothetical protein
MEAKGQDICITFDGTPPSKDVGFTLPQDVIVKITVNAADCTLLVIEKKKGGTLVYQWFE